MKRRIPIFKFSSFNDPDNKALIQQQLYSRILHEIKLNVNTNKTEIVIAKVQDDTSDNSYSSINIDREGFIPNLQNMLNYYESKEDFEQCALISKTIKDLK